MEVYARAVKRRERLSGVYLEEFDKALQWALMGTVEGFGEFGGGFANSLGTAESRFSAG